MNQDLAKYINKAIADGMSEAEIKNKLIDAGWQEKDINNAFSAHEKLDLNKTPVFKEKANSVFRSKNTNNKTLKIGLMVGLPIVVVAISASAYFFISKQKNAGNELIINHRADLQTSKQYSNNQEIVAQEAAVGEVALAPKSALPETGEVIETGGIEFYKIGAQYKGAYNPFEINGKIGYFAEKEDKKIIVYDGREYGEDYDRVS